MTLAPVEAMTTNDLVEYIDSLERQVRDLTAKTDNRKRLEPWEVSLMRKMYHDETPQYELAEIFNVSTGTVSRIVRGIYHAIR